MTEKINKRQLPSHLRVNLFSHHFSGKYDGWFKLYTITTRIDVLYKSNDSVDQFTLEVLRLPRITLAILAGAALGMSGLMLQNVLKNPIASPDIIGITGGASLSAVVFIAFSAI